MDPARALVTSPTIRNDTPAAPDDWAMVVLIKGGGGVPVVVTVLGPTIATVTSVGVGVVSTTLLLANPARLGGMIWNTGPTPLYLKLGLGAAVGLFTAKLYPNSYFELPFPAFTGPITAIRAAGVGAVQVTELT